MSGPYRIALQWTLWVALFLGGQGAKAQMPSKCFEIESILVDACISATECPGGQEGQNEMVRFRTGPDPVALGDISISWPNNSWRGFVQNATTADLTATLNGTIEGCGHLVEPQGGIIPPGSAVLLVTSTTMCVPANPFTGLSDTLYLVFQTPGNSSGHFANHSNGGTVSPVPTGASGLRTLVMTHVPTACGDTATYDRALLVNVEGTYGGPSALNDGATVRFSWPGVPVATYVNMGCQAPIVPVSVSVEVSGDPCRDGEVQLQGLVMGSDGPVEWSGGTGTFSSPDGPYTTYTPGGGDGDMTELSFCAMTACGDPVCATVPVPFGEFPEPGITASSAILCPGDTVELTAGGAEEYLWSTGSAGVSITVTVAGTYTVEGTNACGTAEASITLAEGVLPEVMVAGELFPCVGGSTVLTAMGADTYAWDTGASTEQIEVVTGGAYSVTGSNACGSRAASVEVFFVAAPDVSIEGSGFLCPVAVLVATGAQEYQWSTGEGSATITASGPGAYTVTGFNACGTGTATVQVVPSYVTAGFQPSTIDGDAPLLVSFTNLAQPPTALFEWDFGDGNGSTERSPVHLFTEPGTYPVTFTVTEGECSAFSIIDIVVRGPEEEVSSVHIPNVFSPNGDGINDMLQVDAKSIARIELRIMNRWGQLVALLERTDQGWDGRNSAGEALPAGTYFYLLEAEGTDGRHHGINGSITLLR